MRQPLERKNGKFHDLDGLGHYAEIVVDELSEMFPDTDLVDIEYLFSHQLVAKFTMKLLEENAERM